MNKDTSLRLLDSSRLSTFSRQPNLILARDDPLNETSMFNDTTLRQLSSSINVNSIAVGEGLSDLYFEVIQGSTHTDILDTISRFLQACCDTLEIAEPWNRYLDHNKWLSDEGNTWRLLYSLYSDSLQEKGDEDMGIEVVHSQQALVTNLFESDSELRLLQLIVDWLEASAAYQDATGSSANCIGNRVHWGNTIHNLLLGSSLFNKDKNKAMVSAIDPDAPRRQKKALHSDDKQDDNNLCEVIFKQVRCGRFDEATALCVNAGQTWRSAVLQGWRLLDYKQNDNSTQLELIGNSNRDLWKLCCLSLASDPIENAYYKATVGALCGHLPSILPVCNGKWEDLLWAHLRVQIETRVDTFLREHYSTVEANLTPIEVLDQLQKLHQPKTVSLQQVFGCVNALMNSQPQSFYVSCQRYLMLGHVASIMQDSIQWIDSADDKFIRFLAHLVLVLRLIGKDPNHEIGDMVLETYVTQLIESRKTTAVESPNMIAYYTSSIPQNKQPVVYSNLMDIVEKADDREKVVKAGIKAGLDICAACRLTIKKSIKEAQQGYGASDLIMNQTSTAEKDKDFIRRIVNTLEWLAFDKKQIEDALMLSNAMIRTFIFIGDTDAAKLTLQKITQIYPNVVYNHTSNSSALREHLCIKAYLDALDSFASWYRHFISGCPKEIEPLPQDATFTDKVHHEQKVAQNEQLKERWAAANFHLAKQAKKQLYNVLLFPGGWLHDQSDDIKSDNFTEEDYMERARQLETLKKLCIPEVVLLLLRILQCARDVESHKDALHLAELIAAENRCLYKVFPKEKMREILQKFVDSATVLIDNGLDTFGYILDD